MDYRIVRPDVFPPFDILGGRANIIAIEKPSALYSFVAELSGQISGENGLIVLSRNGEVLNLSSKAELITQYFPLELNGKRMLNKLYGYFEKKAMSPEMFEEIVKLNTAVNGFMNRLTGGELLDTCFGNVNPVSLFKAVELKIDDCSCNLEERVIDYMTNVCELEGERIFFFLNLLRFIDKEKRTSFFETVVCHGFSAVYIEASSVEPMPIVNQMIIDEDYCII